MYMSRFPCRVCGQPTEGLDTYVVCHDCLEAFEARAGRRSTYEADAQMPMAIAGIPLSPDEVQERLRALLDSW